MFFNLPFASSSSAGRNGKKGEDCLRAKPEFRSPPVAAEQRRAPGESRATLWARIFFGYFLFARKKKVRPRVRRGTQR
ncbi:MAG: hypothetical protein KA779_08050 [Propionivibrio sp.]|jgi:hypothetical protein|nr:hypothetical protein [Propionivibrio sp.]